MTRIGSSAALLALLAASGCSSVVSQAPASVVREVGDVFFTSNLEPVGQAEGGSGTVRLVDLPGGDDIEIQVQAAGLPPGEHAWHIHSGTCAEPGPIVVPFTPVGQREAVDEPITIGADGSGGEEATIPSVMLSRTQVTTANYVLNIHTNPGASPGAAIACAPLR